MAANDKGSITDIVLVTVTSLAGIWLICAAMTGNFTGILAPLVRLGFALTGIMLLLPHQVSSAMLWVNIAGAFLGVPLLFFELKTRHRRPASPAI
jgi:TRAP-type uncharacterized transport system fused permease subunit